MPTVKFGKTKETRVLDDNGSVITEEMNIRDSQVILPVRKYYEIRVRVNNREEEYLEYAKFSAEISKDNTMLDVAFRIEHSKIGDANGYYNIVRCYTQLEY